MANNKKTLSFSPEPSPLAGLPKLLFDRLTDETPKRYREVRSKNFLNHNQAAASVVKEISNLLNTRLSATAEIYSWCKKQSYGYGLPWMYGTPDFQSFDATDTKQWWQIAKIYQDAITYFEPRLKNVKVTILEFINQQQCLVIEIQGDIKFRMQQQPISFNLNVNPGRRSL